MENTFKVEGVVWKITEGQATEVKINGDIFIKKSSLDETYQTVIPPLIEQHTDVIEDHDKEISIHQDKETPIPLDKNNDMGRGELINKKNIHKNVLHEFIQAVKERKNQVYLKIIISKNYPDISNVSLSTYLSNYKRYIIEHHPELKSRLPLRKIKKKKKGLKFDKKKIEKIQQPKDKKGKTIARLGHNSVFEWPLRAFKKALKEERGRSYLEKIIQFYYDTDNISSIHTYVSCYIRYINKTYKESDLKKISDFDESEDLYKMLPPLEKVQWIKKIGVTIDE